MNDRRQLLTRTEWRPNFVTETEVITALLVWVCFPILPFEYYMEKWLQKAGNHIGKTIKVDDTIRETTRGKFVRVYVIVDLSKPLKTGYKRHSREWRLQTKVSLTCILFAAAMDTWKQVANQ